MRNLCRRRARCRKKIEHAFPWLGMRCSNIQSSREMTAFGALAISRPQDYLFVTGRNPIRKTLIKIRNVVIDVVTHPELFNRRMTDASASHSPHAQSGHEPTRDLLGARP